MRTDSMPVRWTDRFRVTFAAFKYRNYRLWFTGQLVSLMGSWMQGTAQGFFVYELTGPAGFFRTVFPGYFSISRS